MSEPSPSSLTPPRNRARASSTSRRPALTIQTCSSRKRGSSFSDAVDPPSPVAPASVIPPPETKQVMAFPSPFSRLLQMLDFPRSSPHCITPSTDDSLLPTMAPSPTLSSFTDTLKEKDSTYTTRSPSVCVAFTVRVADRVLTLHCSSSRHTFP